MILWKDFSKKAQFLYRWNAFVQRINLNSAGKWKAVATCKLTAIRASWPRNANA